MLSLRFDAVVLADVTPKDIPWPVETLFVQSIPAVFPSSLHLLLQPVVVLLVASLRPVDSKPEGPSAVVLCDPLHPIDVRFGGPSQSLLFA